MKSSLISILFSFIGTLSFGQDDFGPDPCEYEHYDLIMRIEEDVEFFVEYNGHIDLDNENCTYSMAENYYNIAPDMQTSTLCVIYIEGKPENTELQFINLFDNPKALTAIIDKIQFVFVTDRRTELWKTYETKEEIQNLFTLDIRKGIK